MSKTPDIKSLAKHGHASVCRLLLEQGADPNAKDSGGKTAFQYAVENRRIKVADFLKAKQGRG